MISSLFFLYFPPQLLATRASKKAPYLLCNEFHDLLHHCSHDMAPSGNIISSLQVGILSVQVAGVEDGAAGADLLAADRERARVRQRRRRDPDAPPLSPRAREKNKGATESNSNGSFC